MDFGIKYVSRIFIYSSAFFGVYLFYTVVVLLTYFGFVEYHFSLLINMTALYDVAVVLGVILVMLYYGAVVND
jgi:hypothetical protein